MKKYQKPAIDVEKFDVADVITASSAVVNDPTPPDSEGLEIVTVVDFN